MKSLTTWRTSPTLWTPPCTWAPLPSHGQPIQACQCWHMLESSFIHFNIFKEVLTCGVGHTVGPGSTLARPHSRGDNLMAPIVGHYPESPKQVKHSLLLIYHCGLPHQPHSMSSMLKLPVCNIDDKRLAFHSIPITIAITCEWLGCWQSCPCGKRFHSCDQMWEKIVREAYIESSPQPIIPTSWLL